MLLTRHERVEQLRSSALDADRPADLAGLAAGDAAAIQSAWSSFVPLLAHPVMAASAGNAMVLLEETATNVAQRHPLPV